MTLGEYANEPLISRPNQKVRSGDSHQSCTQVEANRPEGNSIGLLMRLPLPTLPPCVELLERCVHYSGTLSKRDFYTSDGSI